jgi:tetratricopeptide (TPR) repeat protein
MQIYHEVGNKTGEISALNNLGEVLTWQKDFAAAANMFQRSLALARELGQPHVTAIVLNNLGETEKQEGDFAHAKEHLQEALTQGRHYGDKNLIAWSLMNLADMAAAEGDFAAAKKMDQEVLAIFHRIGVKMNIGGGLQKLADVELSSGDLAAAKKHYSEALQIFTQVGQPLAASYVSCALGDILFAAADLGGARKKYEEALTIRQKLHGNPRYIFDNRAKLARLSLQEGQASDAETAIRQAVREYSVGPEPDAQVEADTVLVRSLLSQKKLAEAQQVIASDRQLMAQSEDRCNRIRVAICDAQVKAASGNQVEASRLLEAALDEARKGGFVELQLEARLAAGETEVKTGNAAAGRAQLESLERDARAKGFLLIARKAQAARMQR